MKVPTTVRGTLLLALLSAAGACSDVTSAPKAAARPAFDIQGLQPLDSRSDAPGSKRPQSPSGAKIDSSSKELTIDPNVSRTYAFGQDWVYFPAHSICDPATSGYGPSYWDVSCTPLTQPIKIRVHWSSRGGYAFAHFSPDLRFVPAGAEDVTRWVVLSLHSQKKLRDLDAYRILYNLGENSWVDESLTDETLRAWLDPVHNSVVRRVKHFSGYMVSGAYSTSGGMGDASY